MFKHKQQLSVLLRGAFFLYRVLYFFYFAKANLRCLVNIDMFTTSRVPFSVGLVFDKTRLRFRALVTFISACVFMFARTYIMSDLFYSRFMWILLSFVLSINVLILSGSFLTLLVGWDGLGVSSFALIIYYQSKER